MCIRDSVNRTQEIFVSMTKQAYMCGDKAKRIYVDSMSVKLVLQHGVSNSTLISFALLAIYVNVLSGDLTEATRIGSMSTALMDKHKYPHCHGVFVTLASLYAWRKTYSETHKPLVSSFTEGMKQGVVDVAFVNFQYYLLHGYLSGLSLATLIEDASEMSITIRQYEFPPMLGALVPLHQVMLNLRGSDDKNDNPAVLTGTAMNEKKNETDFAGNAFVLFSHYLHKLEARYAFGDLDGADEVLKNKIRPLMATQVFAADLSQAMVYDALVPLALATQTGKAAYKKRAGKAIRNLRRAVAKQQKGINLSHRLLLLEAGYVALDRKASESAVKEAFNTAIISSSRTGCRQDAALANLLCGEYFLKQRNDKDWASFYVGKAINQYEDWGASGMARYVSEKYDESMDLSGRSRGPRSTNHHGRRRHDNSKHRERKSMMSLLTAESMHST